MLDPVSRIWNPRKTQIPWLREQGKPHSDLTPREMCHCLGMIKYHGIGEIGLRVVRPVMLDLQSTSAVHLQEALNSVVRIHIVPRLEGMPFPPATSRVQILWPREQGKPHSDLTPQEMRLCMGRMDPNWSAEALRVHLAVQQGDAQEHSGIHISAILQSATARSLCPPVLLGMLMEYAALREALNMRDSLRNIFSVSCNAYQSSMMGDRLARTWTPRPGEGVRRLRKELRPRSLAAGASAVYRLGSQRQVIC